MKVEFYILATELDKYLNGIMVQFYGESRNDLIKVVDNARKIDYIKTTAQGYTMIRRRVNKNAFFRRNRRESKK